MGEISCRALGAKVESFSPDRRVAGGRGRRAGDHRADAVDAGVLLGRRRRSRLHDSYFADYPGVWRHGDWIRITSRGSCVIEGRSDATLNRGGVRMGTAEFYRVVESVPEVADSLVVDTSIGVRRGGSAVVRRARRRPPTPTPVDRQLRTLIRTELSPRHVPGADRRGARGAADAERQEVRGAGEADPRRRAGGRRRCPGMRWPTRPGSTRSCDAAQDALAAGRERRVTGGHRPPGPGARRAVRRAAWCAGRLRAPVRCPTPSAPPPARRCRRPSRGRTRRPRRGRR